MVRLSIYREGEAVLEHPLSRGVTSLGRHTDNHVVLDDLALSRFHARIEYRDQGHVVVDLGSQNGVYVNGARINGELLLKPGDRIGFGRYVAVYDQDVSQRLEPLPSDDAVAPDQPRGPVLALLFNGTEMERFPLQGPGYVIGRSHRCDIVIGLLGLSRRHARVFANAQGDWCVEDLGSQNGTFVNNERINGLHVLQEGDVINFFDYTLVYGANVEAEAGGTDLDVPPLDTLLESNARSTEEVALSEADDFEQGSTELEGALPPALRVRRTTSQVSVEIPDLLVNAPPTWPAEADTEEALIASARMARGGVIEVRQDGRLLTEVPLDRAALRIGSDARCDVALPPLTSINGWHLVVVRVGDAVLLMRVGDAAPPRLGGRPVNQAFLKDGDTVELGRVSLRYVRH